MTRPVIVNDIAEMVDGTGDAAFAVNAAHTIVAWNKTAEEMLGYSASEAIGRSCAQVINGRDREGHIVCSTLCPLLVALRRGDRLRHLELEIRHRSNGPIWVSMTSLMLTAGDPVVIHILRDMTEDRNRRAFVRQVLQGATALADDPPGPQPHPNPVMLSPREGEILRLLVGGAGTRAIAQTLSISPATVRNHVQQIMLALHAHSRLEAVVKAIQRGLV